MVQLFVGEAELEQREWIHDKRGDGVVGEDVAARGQPIHDVLPDKLSDLEGQIEGLRRCDLAVLVDSQCGERLRVVSRMQ